MLDIRFVVEGAACPKGNHQAFPISRGRCKSCRPGKPCRGRSCFGGTIVGTVVTDKGGAELEAWQELVRVRAISARNAAGQRLVERPGAVEVAMIFVMPRPGGHWTDSGALTSVGRAQPLPTVKPDIDKMMRSALDGMTGSVVEDDAQLVLARTAKVYAGYHGPIGLVVRARQISSYPAWVDSELDCAGMLVITGQTGIQGL